jgi:cytochrome P450
VASAETDARAAASHCSSTSWTTECDYHVVCMAPHEPRDTTCASVQSKMTIISFASEYVWLVLGLMVLIHITTTCIYRRYFHPLAEIPGPFIPAITKLYQSYFNCRYYLEIERLHHKYGPVVRITPDEVHIATISDDYEKIYHVGSKYAKSPNFYNALCAPHSSVCTVSNEVYKIKRGAMNPIFSRQRVLDVESIVQDKVGKVILRLENSISNPRVGDESGVDLHHAFRAVSVDVISEFAFGSCYNFLDKDDTGANFFVMARGIGPALYAFQQLPSLQRLALKIPPWLAPLLSRPLGHVTSMQTECIRQIENVKEKMSQGEDTGRPTIFTSLLSDDDKPEGFEVPTTLELKDEAYSVLVAAADTTGNAMTVAAFNVIYNREIYDKLAEELQTRFPDATSQLPFVELERLPYLVSRSPSVCVREYNADHLL